MEQIIEEWRPIDVPGYLISNNGNLKSTKIRKISIATFINKSGYKEAQICKSDYYKDGYNKVWIHKLVAKAFIPNPDNKTDIRHKNNDKLDNRVENLEWYNFTGYRNPRKFDVNECYFDEIDTEGKAYFLGLMYADGYNRESKRCINLSLVERDKYILEKFNKELGSNRPLKFIKAPSPNHQNQFRLVVHSTAISKALAKKGCYQGKSLTLEFPNWLPEKLFHHFVRGYFDGDGCISSGYYGINNRNFLVTATIASSQKFCKSLSEELAKRIPIQPRYCTAVKSKPEKIWRFYITKIGQPQLFMDWLYKDATIYLQRKWDKYEEIKKEIQRVNSSKR